MKMKSGIDKISGGGKTSTTKSNRKNSLLEKPIFNAAASLKKKQNILI